MLPVVILGLIAVFLLAYWNGANDVSKTIATIVRGSGGKYKKAVVLGATFNALGTFLALFFAQEIIKLFTKGLLHESEVGALFAASVIIGAMLWVFFSTKFGMPISTTHSLMGAIIFLGLYVFSFAGVKWKTVGLKIVLPLIFSPLVSFILAITVLYILNKINSKLRTYLTMPASALSAAHWLSAAAASFARGMNDGPKFVALAATFLISTSIDPTLGNISTLIFAVCALSMGIGGMVHGFKVTKTLSYDITPMGHQDGLVVNLVTAFLITYGASVGIPMSTTHVSSFAIVGIGSHRGFGNVNWNTMRDLVLSWMVTIPLSGVLAVFTYVIIKKIVGM